MSIEEFAEWVKSVGGTSAAAKMLGMSPAQVSNYLSGYRKLGTLALLKIQQAKSGQTVEKPERPKYEGLNFTPQDEIIYIPYYLRKVNAGVGIDFEVPGEMQFPVVRSRIKHPAKAFAVGVSGESMRELNIDENTVLICERVETEDMQRLVGKRLIVGYEGASYVKTLIKKNGKFYLQSENADKKSYPDMDLNPNNEWKVLAIVIGMQTFW